MTVEQLAHSLSLETLSLPEPDREITGGYAGDLLSWVMGRARSGDSWVTIMTNLNVIAVASLADVACVVIAEGADLPPELITRAEAQGVNMLRGDDNIFKLSAKIAAAAGLAV